MSSRMVKLLLLASVLLIAFPVVAGASTSRLAGMGTQGDYIKDYTNIFTYPSCVPSVGNLVYGEFGTVASVGGGAGDDRAVGAVLGNLFDGKFGTFAFHMREYAPALGTGSKTQFEVPVAILATGLGANEFGTGFETFLPTFYADPNVGSSGVEAFDLMWGKKLSSMTLGLRFNRSAYKQTLASTPIRTFEGQGDLDRNIMGFGGGLGFDVNPNTKAEVAVLYQSRTYKLELPGSVEESDGGGAYLVAGRMMWQWQPNVMVVPVVRVYSFDVTNTDTPTGLTATKFESTLSGWQAGVAGNWTLNQNDLFVTGVTFASNSVDQKTAKIKDTESLMPTLFASLETHVNSWLTLRFGGRKGVFYSVKNVDSSVTPVAETKTNDSPFQFFTGAGVKLGTLQFDATLAQDFFQTPSNYALGNVSAPLFPKVTATYTF